jgi:formate hydrogenlyase subunit 3/multisubunit Na+/H+ antiporter MnhD subunit
MTSRISVLMALRFLFRSTRLNSKERFIQNRFGEKIFALLAIPCFLYRETTFPRCLWENLSYATRDFIFPTKTVISNIDRLQRTVLLIAYVIWFFTQFFPMKVWKQARKHGRGIPADCNYCTLLCKAHYRRKPPSVRRRVLGDKDQSVISKRSC